MLKSWEWPGDKAVLSVVHCTHTHTLPPNTFQIYVYGLPFFIVHLPMFTHTQMHTHIRTHMIHVYLYRCIQCPSRNEANKGLATLAVTAFDIPGDARFPLNAFMTKPANRGESGEFRN